ncbi:YbaB/EbfC family nucleoid-associated protein [Actinoplanes sp. NBC_00393]|uniref:YbaB/EbfC family nucleoid-associated protein n=1 Tax=Actinoplanes sp. NBC_00393 TaxID=2975953 RepID=UPI002E2400E6
MRDIDAAEDWLDTWTAGVNDRAARAAQLARRVSDLTARARSHDGSITVVVGANGQVLDLELDDRLRELSRQILRVMREAQHRLNDQVARQVEETVGADSETGRAVLDAFARRFPEPDGR